MNLLDQELDSLSSLEERIHKAVELVAQLRADKESLLKDLKAAAADREQAVREAVEIRTQSARMAQELETLRAERAQVRARIEKLLGQMDLLSAG